MADIYSLQFDEVITYLESESDIDWRMTRADGSKAYLFWLNTTDNSGSDFQYYYSTGGVNTVGALNFYIDEDTNTYRVRPQSSGHSAESSGQSFPSGWVLVCHQYNRDTFKWEIAITPEGGTTNRWSASQSLTNDQTINNPDIGRRADGNSARYYGGRIGHIAVTPQGVLLTDSQLDSMASSFLNYNPSIFFTPVLNFPFNEGTGTNVTDTIKGTVLTGIGFAGDNSQWILEGSSGGLLTVTSDYVADINLLSQSELDYVVDINLLSQSVVISDYSIDINLLSQSESSHTTDMNLLTTSNVQHEFVASFLNTATMDFISILTLNEQVTSSYQISFNLIGRVDSEFTLNVRLVSSGSGTPINKVMKIEGTIVFSTNKNELSYGSLNRIKLKI